MVEVHDSLILTEEEVRTIVDDLRPDWTVRDVAGIPGSANGLYDVAVATTDGERALICKYCESTDPESFRPEPYVYRVLARRTWIPVPDVLSIVDDHPAIGGPLYLMERCDGRGVATRGRSLDPQIRERIAREAGRNLGRLHAVGSFDRFGAVRLGRDVAHDRAGIETPDCVVTERDGAYESWRGSLLSLVEFFCSRLDERFADLAEPIREAVDVRLDVLGGEQPVLSHVEYTFWNLLVDPETGETTAVLDFEDGRVACREYDVAAAIDSLSALAPIGSPRRRRVREALYAGYGETNSLDRRAGVDSPGRSGSFDARRDLYRLAVRLPMLVYFESGMVVGPADPETLTREHREFVDHFV